MRRKIKKGKRSPSSDRTLMNRDPTPQPTLVKASPSLAKARLGYKSFSQAS